MRDWLNNSFGYELSLNPIDWSGVSGVADILMVFINIFLLATVWHGIRNIRETRKSRDADMMHLVLEQMNTLKPAIRTLKEKQRHAVIDWDQDEEACQKAHEITVGLQRVGYLGVAGMINKRHLIEMWGPTFVEQWKQLEPYVRRVRVQNKEPADLAAGAFSRKDFERFAGMSSKYLKRRYPAVSRKFNIS